jgi:rfaE bifunctional protein kinase chain/domain
MTNNAIIKAFGELHVCVIGDVMIDEYIWGEVERMSPEAPVPVVDVHTSEKRLGGAANVALNCQSLGAKVTVASVVGQDDNGILLKKLLETQSILTDTLLTSEYRKTTCKQRIMSKGQQMMRVDYETRNYLEAVDEHKFIDVTLRYLQVHKPDVVIFEDYNKGVLKEHVIDKILEHCKLLKLPVAVDPKKENFFSYKGVTIFKPNLKEIKDAFEQEVYSDVSSLDAIHAALHQKLGHDNSLITLSENGVYVSEAHKEGVIYPAFKRHIADVSGAGDTVIAVAAMVYAVTKDIYRTAQWSNMAGGIVCETSGVVSINPEQLLAEILKNNL